jgi:hypothetical protein
MGRLTGIAVRYAETLRRLTSWSRRTASGAPEINQSPTPPAKRIIRVVLQFSKTNVILVINRQNKLERHLEQYGDWVVPEFGEDGRRCRLITWYVFDSDKFRRGEPGWCGTSITEYRNGVPSHVTLLDAAGLEVEAWGVDGDGRRVGRSRPADFSGTR